MIKKLTLTLLLAFCLLVVGCGKKDAATPSGTPTPTPEPQEDTQTDYSKYLDASGNIVDVVASDYVTIPDYNKDLTIDWSQFEPLEDKKKDLKSEIAGFLNLYSSIKSYPVNYTNRAICDYRVEVTKAYAQNARTYYSKYGWTHVYDQYGSEEAYLSATETTARQIVKLTLVYLAIAEEKGITADVESAKAYYESFEADYESLVNTYGENYLVLQYKCDLVLEAIIEEIKP